MSPHTILLSVLLGVPMAWLLGSLLGRIGVSFGWGIGLVRLLTVLRVVPLLSLAVPLLEVRFGLPTWLTLGLVVGVSRAVAVARWICCPEGDWAPPLAYGLLRGRSSAAVTVESARSRGAVTAAVAGFLPEALLLDFLSNVARGSLAPVSATALLLFLLCPAVEVATRHYFSRAWAKHA